MITSNSVRLNGLRTSRANIATSKARWYNRTQAPIINPILKSNDLGISYYTVLIILLKAIKTELAKHSAGIDWFHFGKPATNMEDIAVK